MLKNFLVLTPCQVPDIEPFRGSVVVTDGTRPRPDGIDFEADRDLVAGLKAIGYIVDGQDLYYFGASGVWQVIYSDCGVILGVAPVHIEIGDVICAPQGDGD